MLCRNDWRQCGTAYLAVFCGRALHQKRTATTSNAIFETHDSHLAFIAEYPGGRLARVESYDPGYSKHCTGALGAYSVRFDRAGASHYWNMVIPEKKIN